MKRMWIVGVLALAVVVIVATPAGAAAGGNGGNAKLCQKDGWKTLTETTALRLPISTSASAMAHMATRS